MNKNSQSNVVSEVNFLENFEGHLITSLVYYYCMLSSIF
jgi:hypothetical protein